MAFPVVEDKIGTGGTSTASPTAVSYPATVSAGALLVCIARCAVVGAIGWPSGWNELVEDSSDGSDDVSAIAWKAADGSEGGTTFSVTHGTGKSAYIVYSITGAENPATQPPQISTVAVGTSTTPNPTLLTPTGGTKDYLWLWLGCWEGEQTSPPAGNPTDYSATLGASSGTAGAVTTNVRCASAQHTSTDSSEDAGSWTISASDDWTAWVMAVHPASVTAIGDTTQHIWNIRSTVGDTSQSIWNIRAAVGDIAQAIWNVRAAVGDTSQALWNVLTSVGKAVQKVWNVRTTVGQTRQAIWHVCTTLGDTVQPIWNVLSSVTAVGDVVDLQWRVRQAVGKTAQQIWNVRSVLGDTIQAVWSVRAAVGKSVQKVWNVRAAIGKAVQQVWHVRRVLGDTVQAVWNVLSSSISAIGDVVQLRWKVFIGLYQKRLSFEERDASLAFMLMSDSLEFKESDTSIRMVEV